PSWPSCSPPVRSSVALGSLSLACRCNLVKWQPALHQRVPQRPTFDPPPQPRPPFGAEAKLLLQSLVHPQGQKRETLLTEHPDRLLDLAMTARISQLAFQLPSYFPAPSFESCSATHSYLTTSK